MRKKRAFWNLVITLAMIVTGLISVISLFQIFTPITFLEIFESPKYSGIVFILFIILFAYKYYELKKQSQGELPDITLEPPYVDERIVIIPSKEDPEYSSQTGTTSGTVSQSEYTPRGAAEVKKYYFAHAVFKNDPMASIAKSVIATIEFYDSNFKQIPIYNFYGRWGQEKEQPHRIDYRTLPKQQYRIDILPNGDKYELDIAMKHKSESFCFAFNDTSYSVIELRKFEYALIDSKIFVCIVLNGEKIIEQSYWFELLNEGKNGTMKIKEIAAPKQ